MNTAIEESAAQAAAEKPKAAKKARVGRQGAHVAPKKGKAAKKASSWKKPPKAAKKAGVVRDGSKAAKVLELVKRPDGATLAELMKTTGWQREITSSSAHGPFFSSTARATVIAGGHPRHNGTVD